MTLTPVKATALGAALGLQVVLLALLLVLAACRGAEAQEAAPPPDETAKALELLRELKELQADEPKDDGMSVGDIVVGLLGLGGIGAGGWTALVRYGARFGLLAARAAAEPSATTPAPAPDIGAQLAQIAANQARLEFNQGKFDANQERDHDELVNVRDHVHDLRKALLPLDAHVEDLGKRVERLEDRR